MTTARTIDDLIQIYLQVFPEEKANLSTLIAHSRQHDEGIFSRKTVPGHITAAGYIIARDTHRILLIEHAVLRKFMQPGGHYEPGDEDMLQTAKREIVEETGLADSELRYQPIKPEQPLVPFDIGVHDIPENPKKGEPAHQHYDFCYLFLVDAEFEVRLDAQESTAFRWTDLETFAASEVGYRRAVQKLTKLKILAQ
jgi:8-oxo-dGTP pyrophosphatase MutT (NUDIX family)